MIKQFIKHLTVLFLAFCQMVFPTEIQELPHPQPSRKKSKKPDRRIFTQEDYDHIMDTYFVFTQHNTSCERHLRLTQKDLVNALNEQLGYTKTTSAYAPVWNGKIDRETLPVKRKL